MKKILEISNLSKKYQSGKVVAVENISLDLNKGEIATIVGSSGSGKTTLLRIISGLEIPENGTITLEKEILNNTKLSEFNFSKQLTLSELGKKFNISSERVRQIAEKSFADFKKVLIKNKKDLEII